MGDQVVLSYFRVATFPLWACLPTSKIGHYRERKEMFTFQISNSGLIPGICKNTQRAPKGKEDYPTEK